MWIAGVSICVLAASGVVAIVRAIPASYASIPDDRASSKQGGVPSGFEDAQADGPQARPAEARETINRRTRVRCRDCGVVESIRQIERSSDVGRQDTVAVKIAGGAGGGASGSASTARAIAQSDYEITVRFRDGSTTVINEANAGMWQLGNRVIVIGRSKVSNN
jgi:outer membrane lipoprotein SlyB